MATKKKIGTKKIPKKKKGIKKKPKKSVTNKELLNMVDEKKLGKGANVSNKASTPRKK